MSSYFYIATTAADGGLTVGATPDISEFAAQPGISKVVYVEIFSDDGEATARVTNVSALDHFQQVEMIERFNADWADLSYRFAS
jgi:predicted GIY-YIG superfamily endonuclease